MFAKSLYGTQLKSYEVPIWLDLVYYVYSYFIRSSFRWFMEKLTGRSLLERVLLKNPKHFGCVTTEVERLISEYDIPQLCNGWTEDNERELSKLIVQCQCLETNDEIRVELQRILERSLKQIREYKELCEKVEKRRKEKYDSMNVHHRKKLTLLWNSLFPHNELKSLKTKQWQMIGFQGDDPSTDFRGMGMLALDQLSFFVRYDVNNAVSVLHQSVNDETGFPMAITGITITSTLCDWLHKGYLKRHFYNTVSGSLKIDDFHHAYCVIFKLFSSIWTSSKPPSIMAFNSIFEQFCERLIKFLNNEATNLNILSENELQL
uniref:ELMO domain-containing protein n=1 Tax=Syphacia muris TaxID=451379 RepID=A0A0N5A9B5_9BILA